MDRTEYKIETNLHESFIENSQVRDMKAIMLVVNEDLDSVFLHGIGKSGKMLKGGFKVSLGEMDNLVKTWTKHRKEHRIVWEVLHYTMCDGWVNTWSTSDENGKEIPWLFISREAAAKELDEFLDDINSDPERNEEDKYERWEFRIRPKNVQECNPASLHAIGIETYEEGERVMVELNEFYEGEITEIKAGFLTIMDEYGCTEDVTLDEVRKL